MHVPLHDLEAARTASVYTDEDTLKKDSTSVTIEDDGKEYATSEASGSTTPVKETTPVRFLEEAASTPASDDAVSKADGEDEITPPTPSESPPPYEFFQKKKDKPIPPFEADPVRHVLGMKLPTAETGFCACELRTTNFAIVFFITLYAVILIVDSFGLIHRMHAVIRAPFSYRFHLFLTLDQQYTLHFWMGVFLLVSAFVLWLATLMYNRKMLWVWMCCMLVYVMTSLVLFLVGMLLNFAADGWNMPATEATAVGVADVALQFYLLHMVYSYNRYMFEKPEVEDIFDPVIAARRQEELERLGLREVYFMGIPIIGPIRRTDANGKPIPYQPPTRRTDANGKPLRNLPPI